jgi:tetratricopeptide (TPR) repeat protein
MKYCLIIMLLVSFVPGSFAKEDKSADKNKRIVDKEEARFQKDLRKNTDTGIVYMEHADNLAAINSEAPRALNYYKLALKYDSTNPELYKNYGKYLFERNRAYAESKEAFEKALKLSPNDEDLKNYLIVVNKTIDAQAADNRLRDFGTSSVKALNQDTNYKVTANFDSLKKLVTDPENKYYYQTLVGRYLADDKTLSPQDMYMLIIGYSRQQTYNPFNYNDITEMKMIAGHDLDMAISKGKSLIESNPINPTLNKELMYYYRKKNDTEQADKYLNRVKQFFNGVLYSGNGTCERPYVSLWAKEEYNMITYIGYKPTDTHAMGSCAGKMAEIIDAITPDQKTEQIYFNVALIYMQATGK